MKHEEVLEILLAYTANGDEISLRALFSQYRAKYPSGSITSIRPLMERVVGQFERDGYVSVKTVGTTKMLKITQSGKNALSEQDSMTISKVLEKLDDVADAVQAYPSDEVLVTKAHALAHMIEERLLKRNEKIVIDNVDEKIKFLTNLSEILNARSCEFLQRVIDDYKRMSE